MAPALSSAPAGAASGSEAGRCRPYGAVEIHWGMLVFPRLRRGLHDRARYAGFWVRTPGAQPKVGDMVSPKEEGSVLAQNAETPQC